MDMPIMEDTSSPVDLFAVALAMADGHIKSYSSKFPSMVNEKDSQNRPGGEKLPPQRVSLFEELKRRKVFRVAITYAVASWIIIQVASTTFGSFGIPEWAFRFVVLMVLLGFPVAIILTWAFELTPEGVRKTVVARSMDAETDPSSLNRKRNWYTIGMAAILPTLIFGTLAIVFYFTRSPVPSEPSSSPAIQEDRSYEIGTVAVLPFTLFSEDAQLRSTADGLQDEMLTILSEMDPLNIVSRTSTLQFSSDTSGIPEIGKILGADFIVEGSIQTVGDKISITLQLIEASEDNHVWAQSFDRSPERPDEPLVFQKEMAFELVIRIYQALEKTYPPEGAIKASRDKLLGSMEAALMEDFDAFWLNWKNPGWVDEYDSILEQIDRILQIDPDNFMAHDASAAIRYQAPEVGKRDFYDPEWQKDYYLVLKRSYAVAPDGFDTNKHMGAYYYYLENRPQLALPYSRRAVTLDKETRGSVDLYTYWVLLESLCATGQSAAAIRISEEATSSGLTNFSGPAWFWTKGHQMLRRNEEQMAFFNKQLEGARAGNKQMESRFYQLWIALAEAHWTGSREPLNDFLNIVQQNPDADKGIIGMIAFMMENYPLMLEILAEIQSGTSWNDFMAIDRTNASAWAYLKTGNIPLANSYFKGFLNELETSLKGKWIKKYQPDQYAAFNAYGNACLGNRVEALQWADEALEQADPARHFKDYFNTMHRLAVTYAILGEVERACELIELMLSSPSGFSTGEIMIDPLLVDLADSPHFEKVITKHADQLKDPDILKTYF